MVLAPGRCRHLLRRDHLLGWGTFTVIILGTRELAQLRSRAQRGRDEATAPRIRWIASSPLGPPEEQRPKPRKATCRRSRRRRRCSRRRGCAPCPRMRRQDRPKGRRPTPPQREPSRGARWGLMTSAMARIAAEPPMAQPYPRVGASYAAVGLVQGSSRSSVTVLVPQTSVDQHCECLKDLRGHVTR